MNWDIEADEITQCAECKKEMNKKLMVFIHNPNGDYGWYCSYKCAKEEMDGEMFLNGEKDEKADNCCFSPHELAYRGCTVNCEYFNGCKAKDLCHTESGCAIAGGRRSD